MSSFRYAVALAGVTMLAGSLYAVPAGATTARTNSTTAMAVVSPEQCGGMGISSVTAAGDMGGASVRAAKPPTRGPRPFTGGLATPPHLYPAGSARLSTTWNHSTGLTSSGTESGFVVRGSRLFQTAVLYDANEVLETLTSPVPILGTGWGPYKAIAYSVYAPISGNVERSHLYGLRNDGVLFRWRNFSQRLGSYPGFSQVKSMTLISQTATYDTFLANTRSGSLITIRIPVTSPMKVFIKQVRSRTWQGFETLIAGSCGQSTLLTGIDKDTGSAHLYAIGHVTGPRTPMVSYGKIPGTFPDPVYFLHTLELLPPVNGE